MCHEGQSLSGACERIDIRPVGSSLGVFTGPAMMSAAFARPPWPSFQRPSLDRRPPGRHSAGILQDTGTAIAPLRPWRAEFFLSTPSCVPSPSA